MGALESWLWRAQAQAKAMTTADTLMPHCPLRAQQGLDECNTVAGTSDRRRYSEAPRKLILTGVCWFLNPRSAPLGAIYCRPNLNEYLPLSSEEMRNQREGLNLMAEVPAMWQARLVGQLVVGYA